MEKALPTGVECWRSCGASPRASLSKDQSIRNKEKTGRADGGLRAPGSGSSVLVSMLKSSSLFCACVSISPTELRLPQQTSPESDYWRAQSLCLHVTSHHQQSSPLHPCPLSPPLSPYPEVTLDSPTISPFLRGLFEMTFWPVGAG